MGAYRKQEQEEASTDITEVAPGVLRLQLPIRLPGLGHVNCYALEDDRGVALVDPGLPGPASWAALEERLAAASIPLARVHSVIVTHSHPDHFGGASRLRH
jgi:glyoxylase-like metal-dependent hydrolase (beta-lactamase superfamily II)